jgi:hypothetical protein
MGRDTMNVPRRTGGLTAYAVGEAVAITASQMRVGSRQTDRQEVGRAHADVLGARRRCGGQHRRHSRRRDGLCLRDQRRTPPASPATARRPITAWSVCAPSSTTASASTLAGAVDAASGHDTFAEIDPPTAKVMGKLPQYVYMRGKPSFYCSQVAWANVFQRLIIGAGGISKDDATGKIIYQYLGFPVEITPSMPTSRRSVRSSP